MRSYERPVLLWFTKGQGRITVSGITRGFGPHNAVFLPPRTMHGFEMFGHVFGACVFLSTEDLVWPEEPMHLRLRDAIDQAELTGLIDAMEREAGREDISAGRAVHHRAGLLSVFLERRETDGADERPERREPAADRLVAAFTALVERDFREAKSIADYARDLGVTPTHLTRVCKATSGRGALDIVADRRLYEARRLLVESVTPIQEIAGRLGFGSAAYFTRAFRAGTGMSPSQFRKARETGQLPQIRRT